MSSRKIRPLVVAVFGGDGRAIKEPSSEVLLRYFPSSKYGGNGRHASALASIRRRSVDLVLILVQWLGHSQFHAVVGTCVASGVPHRVVAGGASSAVREIRAFLHEHDDGDR